MTKGRHFWCILVFCFRALSHLLWVASRDNARLEIFDTLFKSRFYNKPHATKKFIDIIHFPCINIAQIHLLLNNDKKALISSQYLFFVTQNNFLLYISFKWLAMFAPWQSYQKKGFESHQCFFADPKVLCANTGIQSCISIIGIIFVQIAFWLASVLKSNKYRQYWYTNFSVHFMHGICVVVKN